MDKILHTKFGNAKIDGNGYYRITSKKEGNHNRQLHRLIAEDYFGDWINDPNDKFDIHHIDGNKLNNCVLNLEPIPHNEHTILHNDNHKGENNPNYKPYATVVKKGFNSSGKQRYGIYFNGKEMWAMTDKKKLIDRFCAEYSFEIIKKNNK